MLKYLRRLLIGVFMNIKNIFNNIRLSATIAFSKTVILGCRLFKLGGTSLPGKLALKIYPQILAVLAQDFKIIMVTGTNGKTTTTRMIAQILKENNIGYITNKSGANLLSGITSTFIEAVNLYGGCSVSTALIEADEAAFNQVTNYLEPDVLVVTNFFRDQLDRYGELYSTLKSVKSGIQKTKKTKLILNADDSLCASLGKQLQQEIVYYGIAKDAYKEAEEIVNSDAIFCIYCKEKYEYDYHTYGHLGGFNCPACGYKRPVTTVTCTDVQKLTSSYTEIRLSIHENHKVIINLPGLYNVYNALAAAACGMALGLPDIKTLKALENFECGFGRMETIKTSGKNIKLILVKNPAGFNQVINYLLTVSDIHQLAFAINDKLADGTDVSWLWDVDIEKLLQIQNKTVNFYTAGTRAEDMAVRLKYAGIDTNKISIIKDYKTLVRTGLSRTPDNHCFYILPTYTAMLEIRKVLKRIYNLKEFWK